MQETPFHLWLTVAGGGRRILETLGFEGKYHVGKSGPCTPHASLRFHPMPPRTIEESHRPQVSDRTMRCHSFSGQQSGLLSQKTIGAVTRTEMESQRRAVLVRTAGAAKTTLATMRGGANSWAECRPNRIGIEFSGEIFLLTFPFIGHSHSDYRDGIRFGCKASPAKIAGSVRFLQRTESTKTH